MSTPPADSRSPPKRTASGTPSVPPKRRSWHRWLLAAVIILLLFIYFLPNLIALPWARQKLLDSAFARVNAKATMKDLSLGWFSPVSVGDFELQAYESGHNTIAVKKIDSDASLVNLIFRHDVGSFRIDQPELYVQFDKDGNNVSRLLKALGGSTWGNRAATLDIVDGRLLLRGPNSAQPWKIDGLNLNVAMIPSSDSPDGVPLLHGDHAQLLHNAELTPEMCNDIIKFVVPPLANTTRTSGRVSLNLEQFSWPLGKPNAAELKGQLTLHSVDCGPGELIKSIAGLFKFSNLPATLQLSKDDDVAFNMHDGRVYHENLIFSLPVLEQSLSIRSHGSVGLDETLDLSVELTLPDGADLTAHPGLTLLRQTHPTIHVGGTLNSPIPSLENSPTAVMAAQALADFLERRAERREQQGRPGLLPSRRDEARPTTPPSSGQPKK